MNLTYIVHFPLMMPSDRLHHFLAKWEGEDSINEITTHPNYLKFYVSLTWVLCSKPAKPVNHRFGSILQDQVLREAINRWIGKTQQDSLNYYWDVINKKLYGLSCWLNLLPKWTCYNQFTFVTLNLGIFLTACAVQGCRSQSQLS